MQNKISRLDRFYNWVDENKLLLALRDGMVLAIPVIMVGSFSLLLKSIPIAEYQKLLSSLFGGAVLDILTLICNATLELISLVLLLTISFSYGRVHNVRHKAILPAVSLCCYCAFAMDSKTGLTVEVFRSSWLFNALLVALLSSFLFSWLAALFARRTANYGNSSDSTFSQTVELIFPAVIVIALFALFNVLMNSLLGQHNFQMLFSDGIDALFAGLGRGLGSGLLFIFSLHLMWFFGIHGGNVLDGVAHNVFNGGLEINAQLLQAGQVPTEIVTKSFLDTFVLFGGCGTLLCLIAAILLCEKRSNVRDLSKIAAVPVLFNINEIMVFGLPVVFNPIYFIPFLCTPLLLTVTSYAATAVGLVPYVSHSVEWTTPIFLSGYAATGSFAGTLLQLFNLVLGTLLYIPFVRYAQKRHRKTIRRNIERLAQEVMKGEENGERPPLLGREDQLAPVAKMLASDLRRAVKTKSLVLFYQPQVRHDGTVVGAEALLRWNYQGEFLYPPLAIALAEEAGFADELGLEVLRQSCDALEELNEVCAHPLHLSVNITAGQLNDPEFPDRVRRIAGKHSFSPGQLALELTEQTALTCSQVLIDRLFDLRNSGIQIVMDDFGVGHSSLMYLQNNQFDLVKLDGSLVKGVVGNSRSREIISTILSLSQTLGFEVLAEFVETEEQKEALFAIGCEYYQGYLYSPALPLEEFTAYIQSRSGTK